MSEEIQACKCGSENDSVKVMKITNPRFVAETWFCHCRDCKEDTGFYETREEAIEAWNKYHASW